jgi:broad specificity phosphatase PhoE
MNISPKEKVLYIMLVRHGETDWNRINRFQGQSGVGLNERGMTQAEALASTLKGEPLKAIYSSPVARAMETASIINRYHHVSIEQKDGLKEMNLGDFEGLQPKDLINEHSDFFRKWMEDPASVRMPNGETLQEVQERAWVVVEEVANNLDDGSVLFCGHNFVDLMILCKVLGLEINHFRRVRQGVGALSIIERVRGLYSLTRLNDTCHLRGIGRTSQGVK